MYTTSHRQVADEGSVFLALSPRACAPIRTAVTWPSSSNLNIPVSIGMLSCALGRDDHRSDHHAWYSITYRRTYIASCVKHNTRVRLLASRQMIVPVHSGITGAGKGQHPHMILSILSGLRRLLQRTLTCMHGS